MNTSLARGFVRPFIFEALHVSKWTPMWFLLFLSGVAAGFLWAVSLYLICVVCFKADVDSPLVFILLWDIAVSAWHIRYMLEYLIEPARQRRNIARLPRDGEIIVEYRYPTTDLFFALVKFGCIILFELFLPFTCFMIAESLGGVSFAGVVIPENVPLFILLAYPFLCIAAYSIYLMATLLTSALKAAKLS